MAETNGARPNSALSFDVSFDDTDSKPKRPMPKRFLQKSASKTRPLTPQMLAEKQKKAEDRRKALEADKIERIHEREEQCKKIAEQMLKIEARHKALEEAEKLAQEKQKQNGFQQNAKDNGIKINSDHKDSNCTDLSSLTKDLKLNESK